MPICNNLQSLVLRIGNCFQAALTLYILSQMVVGSLKETKKKANIKKNKKNSCGFKRM